MRNETVLIICAEDKIVVEKETLRLAKNLFKEIQKTKQNQINLKNISKSKILKILEFCEHHKNKKPAEIQKPLKSANLRENGVDQWDCEFIDFENLEDLSDLIILAEFFEIEELILLGCAKFASLLKKGEVADLGEIDIYHGCL